MYLSVIIPMYNVEPYVERCLRSLEDQDIPRDDYEIICINDGSPDNSREVVKILQGEYNNITLIDQENQGVSCARNNGIEVASGKYLLFIDPDDYVLPASLGRILKNADEKNVEVSFLGFTFLRIDGSIRKEILYPDLGGKVFTGTKSYFVSRKDRSIDPDRMVAVLFNTAFINAHKFRYLENVPYLEDGEFISRILCMAQRVIFDAYPFYMRITREGSATNSDLYLSMKARNGFFLSAENLIKLQMEKSLSEEQRNFLNQPIAKFVLLPLMASASPRTCRTYRKVKGEIISRNMQQLDLHGCDIIYTRFGTVYNKSMSSFFVFWICRRFLIALRKRMKFEGEYILDSFYARLNLYEKYIIRSLKHPLKEI